MSGGKCHVLSGHGQEARTSVSEPVGCREAQVPDPTRLSASIHPQEP